MSYQPLPATWPYLLLTWNASERQCAGGPCRMGDPVIAPRQPLFLAWLTSRDAAKYYHTDCLPDGDYRDLSGNQATARRVESGVLR